MSAEILLPVKSKSKFFDIFSFPPITIFDFSNILEFNLTLGLPLFIPKERIGSPFSENSISTSQKNSGA
jgi:hypothetical protein